MVRLLLLVAALVAGACADPSYYCRDGYYCYRPYRLQLYYHPDYVEGVYEADTPYYQSQYEWRRADEVWRPPPRGHRIRVGRGHFRLVGLADAELVCDFPTREHLVSNVVWTRADLQERDARLLYRRPSGIATRPWGSTLYLPRVTPLDVGLYRCMASARDTTSGKVDTIFQDVYFYPQILREDSNDE